MQARRSALSQRLHGAYRDVDDVVVVHLHAQVLRLGLLHQAVLELAPLGVQRLAFVVLHTPMHSVSAVQHMYGGINTTVDCQATA